MADKKLNIKVSTTGAKKSKQELKGLSGSIAGVGKAAAKVSAVYFAAKGLINSLTTVIRLSGIQEQAEKKLSTALGRTSRELLNQASALQKVSVFGDEAIIGQQAFLASLKFSEDQIKSIIPVALDLSAATGISLESAVRNTAKTFSGLAGELGELIPQLRDLTAEEMKAGEAVQIMADLFGGQAKSEAETMAGALKQAENSAGDLAEAIGERLAPLTRVLAENFTDVVEQLTAMIEADPKLVFGPMLSETQEDIIDIQKLISEMSFEEARQGAKRFGKALLFMSDAHEDYEFLNAALNALQHRMFATSQEIKRADESQKDFGATIGKVSTAHIEYLLNVSKLKKEQLIQDLKSAALQQGSAVDAMKAVVRAETMEAVAGAISSALKSVPYPWNLIAAAGAGASAAILMDTALSKFATGGDFITSGPQAIMVGDNPGGQERVQVTPLSSPNINGPQGGMTINIQGGVVDESYVTNQLIPALNKATSLGTKLNA